MGEQTKIDRDKRMPTFKIEFYNRDNYREGVRNYKRTTKRMWSGVIEHIQTKENKHFNQISEMLKFMEDRRV